MISRTTARSRTASSSYESARAQIIRWGALMAAIYVVYVIVFPLTPTIYQSDHILEIEQMLRHGRQWFAPLYLLGLLTLFYAYWRILKIVLAFSKSDPQAAGSLQIWALGIGVLSGMFLIGLTG